MAQTTANMSGDAWRGCARCTVMPQRASDSHSSSNKCTAPWRRVLCRALPVLQHAW